jgi:hypothetical protein
LKAFQSSQPAKSFFGRFGFSTGFKFHLGAPGRDRTGVPAHPGRQAPDHQTICERFKDPSPQKIFGPSNPKWRLAERSFPLQSLFRPQAPQARLLFKKPKLIDFK